MVSGWSSGAGNEANVPSTGTVAPKTSYVVAVETDLVLGCGVYKTVQG